MKKQKLAYVLHGITYGGVEVALVSAVPKLHKEFDLKIVCLGEIDNKLISELTDSEKSTFVSFPGGPAKFAITLFSAIKYLLHFKPDIIVCSLWRASLVGAIVKKIRKRVILYSFIHSTTHFHPLDRIFTKIAISKADFILTDSHATLEYVFSEYRPQVPVSVISFLKQPSPAQKSNNTPDVNKEVKFIFLGRIDEVKNIPLALKVISFLRKQGINATLDLYGSDSVGYWKTIAKQVLENGLADVVSFKKELLPSLVVATLKKYSFLIQMSRVEGMAMSVAEAMQQGLVCVVTAVGEIPNYSEDMVSAVYVDIQTSESWDNCLLKIWRLIQDDSLYQDISEAAYQGFRNRKTYADSLADNLQSDGSPYSKYAQN